MEAVSLRELFISADDRILQTSFQKIFHFLCSFFGCFHMVICCVFFLTGRGKKKKLMKAIGPLLIGLKMKLAAFAALAYIVIALIAKKALLASLLSLLISGFIAIKKLLSHHSSHHEVVSKLIHLYAFFCFPRCIIPAKMIEFPIIFVTPKSRVELVFMMCGKQKEITRGSECENNQPVPAGDFVVRHFRTMVQRKSESFPNEKPKKVYFIGGILYFEKLELSTNELKLVQSGK